ncbi:MAG: pantetheine-phosphate adenylyltransferase [Myxococcota bacterium]
MKIALYAGTFDPLTLGHLSVIQRASQVFDSLLVVLAENPSKRPYFTLEERLAFLHDAISGFTNVEACCSHGLVVELAVARGARFLVRGVRGATDADYEAELAAANAALAPEIQTILLPADPQLSKVSSSRLKQLAATGCDVSAYATPLVARALAAAFASQEQNHA